MVKSGTAYAAIHILNYLIPFAVMAVPVLGLKDGMAESVIGGILGALSMWLWVRPKIWDGIARVGVGLALVVVFYEKQFPYIAGLLFDGLPLTNLQNGFLYGGLGWFALGYMVDVIRKKAKR